jgi:enamine deaminase RidA (YjgF/YER057c/UK114 family)
MGAILPGPRFRPTLSGEKAQFDGGHPMKLHNPPAVAPGTGYSHAVEIPANARLFFLAGQLGVTSDGKFAPGFKGQAEQAWRNIGAILAAQGMGYENIVRVTHYLTRPADFQDYRGVRAQFLGSHAPASTMLFISALARPEALVEVEVVAAKE